MLFSISRPAHTGLRNYSFTIMGYLHKIEATHGLAMVQLGGVITGRDLTEACSSLFLDKEWKPEMNHVWDIRSVVKFSVEMDDVKAVKLLVDSFKDDTSEAGRTAIVISGRISDFLVEVGDILMELCRRPVMFFSEVEEARSWLSD